MVTTLLRAGTVWKIFARPAWALQVYSRITAELQNYVHDLFQWKKMFDLAGDTHCFLDAWIGCAQEVNPERLPLEETWRGARKSSKEPS